MPDVLTLLLSSSPFLTGLAYERVNAEARTGLCFPSLFLFFKQDGNLRKKNPNTNESFFILYSCQSCKNISNIKKKKKSYRAPFPSECGKLRCPLSNSAHFVCLQWLVGNVVQRDDALYARMKQREIDAYDSMWDPIFVDDAALGLGEQRNKVLEVLKVKTYCHSI